MSKRLPYTPNSRIRSALRVLWMRSRERAKALQNTNYCCAYCGAHQSKAKGRELALDVHHLDGIDWDVLIELVRERLLQTPDRLVPACPACHEQRHKAGECGGHNTPPDSGANPLRRGAGAGYTDAVGGARCKVTIRTKQEED